MLRMLIGDLRRKAIRLYGSDNFPSMMRCISSDGSMAMVYYRLMQWSRRHHLTPLELLFNKLNTTFCACIIGRGAEFGPGLIFVHANGLFIHGYVRGGTNVTLYHQVTIGGENSKVPMLGNDVTVASGAKVIGPYTLGDGSCVAANSVVVANVAPYTTVMGVPARVIWRGAPPTVNKPTPPATLPVG